jgi:dihydrofolate synthase/folylpolyglutamate synthase
VFERPDVAVITPISLEHTAILGNTCAEIATDKSGIIKPGCVCVMAPQRDEAAAEVIRARCRHVGAELVDVAAEYVIEPREKFVFGQSFKLRGPHGVRQMRTPMLGRHQMQNVATAVAVADALRAQGHTIDEPAIVDGIAHTRIPGRLEVMGQNPLMIADGAHNGESAEALAIALKEYFEWRRCFLILGVTNDKDVRSMGFKLARLCELIVCTRFRNPRSMDPYSIIQEVGFLGPAAVAEESVPEALNTALSHAEPDDLICITGSLYLVAEAREQLLGESVVQQ